MPPLDSAYSVSILLSEDSRSEDQASSRYRLMIVSLYHLEGQSKNGKLDLDFGYDD